MHDNNFFHYFEQLARLKESTFKFKVGDRVEFARNNECAIGTVTHALMLPLLLQPANGEVSSNAYIVEWDDGMLSNVSYCFCWAESELTPSPI